MTGLTDFAAHARDMAKSKHQDDCPDQQPPVMDGFTATCEQPQPHDRHPWFKFDLSWTCPGVCGGCMSDTERDLWQRLADEIDQHLADDDQMMIGEDA